MTKIHFIDLEAQQQHIKEKVQQAIQKVLNHGAFILGPEVGELEKQLAAFCGAKHAVTCANGTDALQLVLMAEGIKPGDAVFVPAFTFVATAEVVPLVGATPFFVDVLPDTFNMCPASLEQAIAEAKSMGLRPRVVTVVDLFGQPADYDALHLIARKHNLIVIADAAQSFGAKLKNRYVGTFGHYTTTSFFPAKPLGCYGDGGAIFTDDHDKAELLRSLRFHGKGEDRYDNVRIGLNSRLDTIQAAILLEKLKIFAEEIEARQHIAARYTSAFEGYAQTPALIEKAVSVWAQYTLVVPDRQAISTACQKKGIPTAIYYPKPLNRQAGYSHYPTLSNGVPVSEHLSKSVISLPMHPYLSDDTQALIIDTVLSALGSSEHLDEKLIA